MLLLFSFEFHNAIMSKMPKMPKWSKCQDAKKGCHNQKRIESLNFLLYAIHCITYAETETRNVGKGIALGGEEKLLHMGDTEFLNM